MTTIRVSNETMKDIDKMAMKFRKKGIAGFEVSMRITPDKVIKELIKEQQKIETKCKICGEKR